MKTLNRASAVILVLALLALDSSGGWWAVVFLAGGAALSALFVSSSRLGYFHTEHGVGHAAVDCPRLPGRGGRRRHGFTDIDTNTGGRAA